MLRRKGCNVGIENVFVHSVVAFWRTGKTAVSWRKVDEHEGKIALTLGNYPTEVVIHLDKAGLTELAAKIGHAAIDLEAVEARAVCNLCGPVHDVKYVDLNGVKYPACAKCGNLFDTAVSK